MKKKRLVLEVTEDFHREIKSEAAFRGITIRKYILQAIFDRMKHDKIRQ